MRIIFYCTPDKQVEFVDDKSVSQLGELAIDIGKPFESVEGKTVGQYCNQRSPGILRNAENTAKTKSRVLWQNTVVETGPLPKGNHYS